MDTISRRDFLRVSALMSAGTIAAACTQPSAPATTAPSEPAAAPAAPTLAPVEPAKYSEAPVLAEKVASGALPPVEERLPENPFVIEGLDGIGKYGGTWRKGFSGQADHGTIYHMNYRGMVNINHEMQMHTYMAESWEVSDDATEFTFHLRKGLKWSDGAPMTAEDFRFYIDDYVLNTDLTPVVSQYWSSEVGGERVPVQFSAPDDFTVKYKFALPKALLPYSGSFVLNIPAVPAHYLKRFHAEFADKETLDKLVAEKELDDWTQLFFDMNRWHYNIERPVHQPWRQLNSWTDEFVIAERNPFFWEVDTAGNQLPYIDKCTYRAFTDREVAIMWATNGEIDCQTRHIGAFTNYTVFKESEDVGDYTVQIWKRSALRGAFFNMTAKDQRIRALFQEDDFRKAVSYAVNREEMRELIYEGFGTDKQYTPPEESPLYYAKLANAYLEYDPDKANALIDGLGYTERDAEGYRLWKDGSGERISWMTTGSAAQMDDEGLLLVDYLGALGFEMAYKGMDRALSIEIHNNNDVHCDAPAVMDYNLVPLAEPRMWVRGWTTKPWAVAWQAWYDDPTSPIAEKPPDGHWIWDIWDIWDELQKTPDEEGQKQLFWRILDIWYEHLPAVGFFGDLPICVVVKNGFKGIHAGYLFDCCSTIYEYIIDNATWYWDEPEKHTS